MHNYCSGFCRLAIGSFSPYFLRTTPDFFPTLQVIFVQTLNSSHFPLASYFQAPHLNPSFAVLTGTANKLNDVSTKIDASDTKMFIFIVFSFK